MDKLRQRQEIQAYRIVRRNVLNIVKSIPFNNMAKLTYQSLIYSNVTERQIKDIYKEIYTKLCEPQYKRTQRQLKAELSFEEVIAQWLNTNAGLRIVSVHSTLIEAIIKVIAEGYENNLSVAEITRNLQNRFGWFKYQALRIARTETTTATNLATYLAGENSEYELQKTWISAQDNRTRRPPKSNFDHLDMNGITVDYDKPFFVGGEELEYPGDPKGAAGNIINCRCKISVTLKEDEFGLPIRKGQFINTNTNPFTIKSQGFENVGFDANSYAVNKAIEYGVKGDINIIYNPKSKNLGGATGWRKDENGIYGSNNKIDVYGKLSDEQIKAVISHEMRHIWQMQSKTFEFKNGFYYWNGEKILSSDTYKKYISGMERARTREKRHYFYQKYRATPWEADAHAHGDAFNLNKSIIVNQPTDIIEPAQWNKPIPLNELTILDIEMLNENI